VPTSPRIFLGPNGSSRSRHELESCCNRGVKSMEAVDHTELKRIAGYVMRGGDA
jgi:hypothetical protein